MGDSPPPTPSADKLAQAVETDRATSAKQRDSVPTPPANVKIYDRPERKGLSPAVLLVVLLVLILLAVFIYRSLVH